MASCSRVIRPATSNCRRWDLQRRWRTNPRLPRTSGHARLQEAGHVAARPCSNGWVGDYRVFRMEIDAETRLSSSFPALIVGLAHAEEPDSRGDGVRTASLQAVCSAAGRLISLLKPEPRPWSHWWRSFSGGRAAASATCWRGSRRSWMGLDRSAVSSARCRTSANYPRGSPATLADAKFLRGSFLDRLRLFGQESLFLIGTRILSGTVSAPASQCRLCRRRRRALFIPCMAS